jgi:GcrA cell cycle regulator
MRGDQDLWSDERVALLERLWREGVTASAIGVQLGGISRSAVLGKINRLRRRASRLAPSTTRQFSTTDESPSRPLPQTSPARRRGDNGGDQSESAYAAAKSRRKRLLELANDSCR